MRGIACLIVCFTLFPALAEARGAGVDHWILSHEGQQMGHIPGAGRHWLADNDTVYRYVDGELSAHPVLEDRVLWKTRVHLRAEPSYRVWLGGKPEDETLAILSREELVAVSTKTGALRYSLPTKGLWSLLAYTSGWDIARRIGPRLPLVKHTMSYLRDPAGGGVRAESTQPPEVLFFDLHTGKIHTRMRVDFRDPKELVRTFGAGFLVGWNGHVARFDPTTRTPLSSPSWRVESELLTEDASFFLSREKDPRLRGYAASQATGSLRTRTWPLARSRFVGQDGGRLFLYETGRLFELNADTGDLLARYALFDDPKMLRTVHARRAGPLTLISTDEPRRVGAYGTVQAALAWECLDAEVALVHREAALLVSPSLSFERPAWDGKGEAPQLRCVSVASGVERWRWEVPAPAGGFCDGARVEVRRGAGGYIVTRHWYVLD